MAAKACRNIYRFQHNLKTASADIVQLMLDVDDMRTLLVGLHRITPDIGEDMSPELLGLWERKEERM